MKAVVVMLRLFIMTPIWYWLTYQVLDRVHATELMWFLYWVYVPVAILASCIAVAADKAEKR